MHHCKYLPLAGNYKETWWLYYVAFSVPVKKNQKAEKLSQGRRNYLLLGLAGFLA